MNIRLSHSAVNKYLACPKSYELHYEQRYREKTTSSALLFGSAMDAALNTLLEDLKKGELVEASRYQRVFNHAWSVQTINGQQENLRESLLFGYAKADFDFELLTVEDLEEIDVTLQQFAPEFSNVGFAEVYASLDAGRAQKAYKKWPENHARMLNVFNWHCLRRKGYLMIDAYLREVVPQIQEVVEVQKRVDVTNDQGDSIIGYIDGIITWKDGRTFPIDNKTSSQEYADHVMTTSQQLGLYAELTGYEAAGYIVLLKQIRKNRIKTCRACNHDGSGARHKTCANVVNGQRCNGEWIEVIRPEAQVQIVIDNITQQLKNNVVEAFDDVLRGIHHRVFPRNLNNCVKPYGKCAFYSLCHKNDDSELDKLEV